MNKRIYNESAPEQIRSRISSLRTDDGKTAKKVPKRKPAFKPPVTNSKGKTPPPLPARPIKKRNSQDVYANLKQELDNLEKEKKVHEQLVIDKYGLDSEVMSLNSNFVSLAKKLIGKNGLKPEKGILFNGEKRLIDEYKAAKSALETKMEEHLSKVRQNNSNKKAIEERLTKLMGPFL